MSKRYVRLLENYPTGPHGQIAVRDTVAKGFVSGVVTVALTYDPEEVVAVPIQRNLGRGLAP
jgi:hypothetical protein